MTNGREDTPPSGFLTLTLLSGPYMGELPPITSSTFTARSSENTPLANHTSTSANPNLMFSPAFVEANYEIIRVRSMRGMEPRPIRVRETTLVLRIGSPRVRRHRGRVVELEDAPNRDGSRVERESDGRRPEGY
ncbi:hypothetical protein Tco_0151356 [Tanacetum coccineum]